MHRFARRRVLLLTSVVAAQLTASLLAFSDARFWLILVPWFLSFGLAVFLVQRHIPRPPHLRTLVRSPDLWIAFGLAGLAALLRLPRLETLPAGIYGDEGEFGVIALAISRGQGPDPFGVAFLGDPALYVHTLAPFVSWMGPTMEAIRLPSALVGIATVPLLYGLVRNLFGRFAATIAAFLLATSAVHIHFSRLALNVIWVPFFTCLSLWLLKRGLDERRDVWFLLAGIAGGLGFYSHFGARLIVPMMALVLLSQCLFKREGWRIWMRGLALVGAGAFMALSPFLATLSRNPDLVTAHTNKRGIWNHWDDLANRYGTSPSDKLGIFWGQVKHTFLAFVSEPDSFYGAMIYRFIDQPMLPALIAALAIVGIIALTLRIRTDASRLILVWLIVPCLFASILTDVAGQAHRLLSPMLVWLIAAALILDIGRRFIRQHLPASAAGTLLVCLLAVPLIAGTGDAYSYLNPGATERFGIRGTVQARCLEALSPGAIALIDGAPRIYARHGPSRYLGNQVVRRDLADASTNIPTDARKLVILVHEMNQADVDEIIAGYPEALSVEVERPPGERALTVIALYSDQELAASDLAACKRNAEP